MIADGNLSVGFAAVDPGAVPPDLLARVARNVQRATPLDRLDWLRKRLPAASLPGTGVVECACDASGRFVPLGHDGDPPGRALVVTTDAYADDLAAFHPGEPWRWWTALGSVPLLGADVADKARVQGARVRVLETPWSWLLAGRSGVVVIDWGLIGPADLEGLALEPETPRLAARLRTAIAARLPRLDGRAAA